MSLPSGLASLQYRLACRKSCLRRFCVFFRLRCSASGDQRRAEHGQHPNSVHLRPPLPSDPGRARVAAWACAWRADPVRDLISSGYLVVPWPQIMRPDAFLAPGPARERCQSLRVGHRRADHTRNMFRGQEGAVRRVFRSAPKPNTTRALGRAIGLRRLEIGLKPEQVADRAQLSQRTLEGIEAGTANPSWDTADRIARALDWSIGELAQRATQLKPKTDNPPTGHWHAAKISGRSSRSRCRDMRRGAI